MKPLDKQQLPKVIALGVLATGLVGYAAYSWLGGQSGPSPANAATPHPAPTAATPANPAATNVATNAVLQLPPINHEDPFKPAIQPDNGSHGPKPAPPPPPAAKPAAKPAGTQIAARPPAPPLMDVFNGPAMDGPPGGPVPAPPPAPVVKPAADHAPAPGADHPVPAAAKPAPAARPEPPAIVVTGVLEGDENVAILKWTDSHRQVVRVGDRLDGGFVVKAIRTDAVVLARGAYQWTAHLGAERPEAN